MVLHYVYVSSFRVLNDIGFNLGGRFRFHYDRLLGELVISENPYYLENFFSNRGEQNDLLPKIENISAIIGENGVGKTTLFDFIKENFSRAYPGINTPTIVALTTDNGEFRVYDVNVGIRHFNNDFDFKLITLNESLISTHGRMEVVQKPRIPEFESVDFVYFSNICDGRIESSGSGVTNISTNFLLKDDLRSTNLNAEMEAPLGSEVEAHRTSDINRQVDFIKTSLFASSIDFSLPHQLIISLGRNFSNGEFLNDPYTSDMLNSYDYSEFLKSLIKSADQVLRSARSNPEKVLSKFVLTAIINRFYEAAIHTDFYRVGFISKERFDVTKPFLEEVDRLLIHLRDDVESFSKTELGSPPRYITSNRDKGQILGLIKFVDFLKSHLNDDNSGNNGEYFVIENINEKDNIKLFFEIYRMCFTHEPFLNLDWRNLSSGQKARLNLYSRFYALSEDSSPNKIKSTNPLKEANLIVLIDEGDLYFHPNWQRKFIRYLLEFIPYNFDKKTVKKRIQIFLTSNSPFVVSDLPSSNVSFLKSSSTGKAILQDSLEEKGQTFAGNIHHLLSDGFFLNEGTIGEFAITKIDGVIDTLNSSDELPERKLAEVKKIISMIGEPVLRARINQIFEERQKTSFDHYNTRISKLEIEISRLKKRKK